MLIFSVFPYNPGRYPTIHQYAYGCIGNTDDFKQAYSYDDPESEKYNCHHNAALSVIVFGIGIVGVILLIQVKKSQTNKN
jgi:hypothetical protein